MDRTMKWARAVTGFAALALFALALSVHFASLFGIDLEEKWPEVWLLHYGIFPFILAAAVVLGRLATPSRRFRDAVMLLPLSARLLIAVAFIYAMANFFIVLPLSAGGQPVIRDGRHYLNDHGVLREVTADEFHAQRNLAIRGFSGHWLFLYLASALVLLTARRAPERPPIRTQ
ncbi:MAG: hypothetical protein GC190_10965 [Alphaproteobacteria bacterium]|nr:hypothetical protein [Alphaproteobacteria bacterium]